MKTLVPAWLFLALACSCADETGIDMATHEGPDAGEEGVKPGRTSPSPYDIDIVPPPPPREGDQYENPIVVLPPYGTKMTPDGGAEPNGFMWPDPPPEDDPPTTDDPWEHPIVILPPFGTVAGESNTE
jgi:hypothetical protein